MTYDEVKISLTHQLARYMLYTLNPKPYKPKFSLISFKSGHKQATSVTPCFLRNPKLRGIFCETSSLHLIEEKTEKRKH